MREETVLVEAVGGMRALTLNRPEKLNSFNETMHIALQEALRDAAADPACRAVLLTGAGRGFCAGQDLSERDPAKMTARPDLGDTLERFFNPTARLIKTMQKPVVCAVNGVAAGAGANLALACDIVLAAESAKFIQAFCKIGLLPDTGGTWSLPHLVGQARAKALALTGVPVGAKQAEDWGMIWRAVPDADLQSEARALTASLAEGPTFGLGLIKHAIDAAATNSFDAQLDLERDLQRRAGKSDDYAEGVGAFMQKRAPKFSGRPN